jgi:hypothetical protein
MWQGGSAWRIPVDLDHLDRTVAAGSSRGYVRYPVKNAPERGIGSKAGGYVQQMFSLHEIAEIQHLMSGSEFAVEMESSDMRRPTITQTTSQPECRNWTITISHNDGMVETITNVISELTVLAIICGVETYYPEAEVKSFRVLPDNQRCS